MSIILYTQRTNRGSAKRTVGERRDIFYGQHQEYQISDNSQPAQREQLPGNRQYYF